LNQYLSIWNSVGGSFSGLSNQFDGVQSYLYWSGTEFAPLPGSAWLFGTGGGSQGNSLQGLPLYAVAVRPGDVAVSSVPEPQAYAMMLAGLGALMVAVRRRPR
jgi:hypothetical protein